MGALPGIDPKLTALNAEIADFKDSVDAENKTRAKKLAVMTDAYEAKKIVSDYATLQIDHRKYLIAGQISEELDELLGDEDGDYSSFKQRFSIIKENYDQFVRSHNR